jgi:hypothetical protein
VQRSVLGEYPDADIGVSIVWIDILEHDSEIAARRATEGFRPDARVRHFYDPEGRVGRAIAQSLGAETANVAWDVYLFYERGSEWIEKPPAPAAWMHQLTSSSWADAAYYHSGDDLIEELAKTMKRLTNIKGG